VDGVFVMDVIDFNGYGEGCISVGCTNLKKRMFDDIVTSIMFGTKPMVHMPNNCGAGESLVLKFIDSASANKCLADTMLGTYRSPHLPIHVESSSLDLEPFAGSRCTNFDELLSNNPVVYARRALRSPALERYNRELIASKYDGCPDTMKIRYDYVNERAFCVTYYSVNGRYVVLVNIAQTRDGVTVFETYSEEMPPDMNRDKWFLRCDFEQYAIEFAESDDPFETPSHPHLIGYSTDNKCKKCGESTTERYDIEVRFDPITNAPKCLPETIVDFIRASKKQSRY